MRTTPADVQIVSALPPDPYDGQQILYIADAANGVAWNLVYLDKLPAPYKWLYIGGPPLSAESGSTSGASSLNTWGASGAPNLTLPVPLHGDYLVHATALIENNGATTGAARLGLGKDGVAPSDANALDWNAVWIPTGSSTPGPLVKTHRINAVTASVGTWPYATVTGMAWFGDTITATPIRLGLA